MNCPHGVAAVGCGLCEAFRQGVALERKRCLEICSNYEDVEDGDYGEPKPNMAMRIATEIREDWK